MKTFVSPIYIQTNQYASEKIACGLLAVDSNKIYFKISNDKIDIASKLSETDIKGLVKTSLELVKNKVAQTNSKLSEHQTSLFEIEHNFNAEYINYLSKYSSGIIQFNEPKPYNAELNQSSFIKLFEKFIGDKNINKQPLSKEFNSLIKKSLSKPELKEKADINYSLKPAIFFGLVKNATVSLVTSNGAVSLYQAVDFETSEANVAMKLYEFDAIKKSVYEFAHKKLNLKTKASIVAVPPTETHQKKLFETVYKIEKSKGFKLLEPSELEEATNKIISEPHQKLSSLVETL